MRGQRTEINGTSKILALHSNITIYEKALKVRKGIRRFFALKAVLQCTEIKCKQYTFTLRFTAKHLKETRIDEGFCS